MTEKEFLDIVRENIKTYYERESNKKSYWEENGVKSKYKLRCGKLLNKIDLDDVILKEWVTGGMSGGNIWDSNNIHAKEGDPEPEFTELDTILEKVSPTITYLQYKKAVKDLSTSYTYTEYEYYGNSTTYEVKIIKLRVLYDRLKSLGII